MILNLLTAGKASFSAIRLLRLPLGSVQNWPKDYVACFHREPLFANHTFCWNWLRAWFNFEPS